MFALPRIVAIDNDEDELKQIQDALVHAHIPCLPIQYDAATWEAGDLSKLCIAVRVVLLDLNLLEGAPNAETITPYIAEVLEAVAPAGPYIIVFWSNHGDLVDEVLARLADRYAREVVAPIHHTLLDKKDYRLTGEKAKDEEVAKKLSSKVEELLHEIPVLEMLADWENRVGIAAASTVSRLYRLAAGDEGWQREKVKSRLTDLITWIAHETVGPKTAPDIPGEAIDQGLHHALADELARSAGTRAFNDRWKAALPEVGNENFKPSAALVPDALTHKSVI